MKKDWFFKWFWGVFAFFLLSCQSFNLLNETEKYLYKFSSHPVLGSKCQKVLKELTFYRQFLKENLVSDSSLEIDVILQRHFYPNIEAKEEKRIKESQKRVKELLDSLKYEIIGSEGHQIDPLTLENCFKEVESFYKEAGYPIDTFKIWQAVENYVPFDGVLQYIY